MKKPIYAFVLGLAYIYLEVDDQPTSAVTARQQQFWLAVLFWVTRPKQ
jgi:hypothetical protein